MAGGLVINDCICIEKCDLFIVCYTVLPFRVLAHSAETGENLWFVDNAHQGGVTALVLSHNHRFILTGGPQGEVRLWELRTRALISHLKEHKQKVTCLALFDDDTSVLSGSRDRCVLRWDLKTEVRNALYSNFLLLISTTHCSFHGHKHRFAITATCSAWAGSTPSPSPRTRHSWCQWARTGALCCGTTAQTTRSSGPFWRTKSTRGSQSPCKGDYNNTIYYEQYTFISRQCVSY